MNEAATVDSAPDPEEQYVEKERAGLVRKAITNLRPSIRRPLELHQLQGYLLEEMAAEIVLAERLPNAQLTVYSDSSHGAQYQHAKTFLSHVKLFLGAESSQLAGGASVSVASSASFSK